MILNRQTKQAVKIGDALIFESGAAWIITNIIPGRNGALCFTIQSKKTKQTLYCYPSSKLYGLEILSGS